MLHRFPILCCTCPRVVALACISLAMMASIPFIAPALSHTLAGQRRHTIPLPLHQKNQGTLLIQQALMEDDTMLLMGSSELTRPMPNRAEEFFKNAPTGFQVCPVGSAGNTCLLMLQKLAPLGEALRNRKVVIILSHSWFERPETPPDHYAGNFSALQAMETIESPALSLPLKQRIASRLLDYPATLEAHPALLMQVRSLRDHGAANNWLRELNSLVLGMEINGLSWEDAFQSRLESSKLISNKPWEAKPRSIEWAPLLDTICEQTPMPNKRLPSWHGPHPSPADERLRKQLASAEHGEWTDFALLLDALKELGAKVLVISMPLPGLVDDLEGIDPDTRLSLYYKRIESMCAERGIAFNTFRDHDEDKNFLDGFTSHPTAYGWICIDKVLDDFWHDRLSPPTS